MAVGVVPIDEVRPICFPQLRGSYHHALVWTRHGRSGACTKSSFGAEVHPTTTTYPTAVYVVYNNRQRTYRRTCANNQEIAAQKKECACIAVTDVHARRTYYGGCRRPHTASTARSFAFRHTGKIRAWRYICSIVYLLVSQSCARSVRALRHCCIEFGTCVACCNSAVFETSYRVDVPIYAYSLLLLPRWLPDEPREQGVDATAATHYGGYALCVYRRRREGASLHMRCTFVNRYPPITR